MFYIVQRQSKIDGLDAFTQALTSSSHGELNQYMERAFIT